jgi:hypothetical protein
MNVHALVHARIVSALEALQREGALPAGLDFANVEVAPTATSPAMPRWCWPRRRK